MQPKMQWAVQPGDRGVTFIRFQGRQLWCYLSSDWHWDSIKCDRDRLMSDLMTAKRLGCPVLGFGDIFDAMGGKYDPRSSKDELRPELLTGNYFDAAVSQCADWLRPVASSLALLTPGNHETAIRKRQETCLTTRLVERLRVDGSPVCQSGYAGWVIFKGAQGKTNVALHRLWYHHGYGGGGPVTRGVIDYARYLADVDADTIVSGHVHQRTLIESTRQRVTSTGIPRTRPIFLVRSSSYKDECMTDGWHVEKGLSSRPIGGWWMRLRWGKKSSELIASFHDTPEI